MKFRKSQAAMEFLMTYGWAILVVLVAIGALAYFGVLNPYKLLPPKCTLPAGIACTDAKMSDVGIAGTDTVELVLRNGEGFDIDPVVVQIDGDCDARTVSAAVGGGLEDDCTAGGTAFNNGDLCTFTITCPDDISEGARFSADIIVTYTNSDSGLQHEATGTLTGRVQ